MKKIIVIGSSGSGKSTFAKKLANELNYKYISLDQLFWKKNWTESSDSEFFDNIQKATNADQWVLDGNYSRSRHITWPHADTIIWIDLPHWRVMLQSIKRSVVRAVTGEELWEGTGNRESFFRMFSKESILLFQIKSYPKAKKRYNEILNDPEYNYINFVRLKSHRESAAYLKNLNS